MNICYVKRDENGLVYFSVCTVLLVYLYSSSSVQFSSNLVWIHLSGINWDLRPNICLKMNRNVFPENAFSLRFQ
jgi:hypothetical protein